MHRCLAKGLRETPQHTRADCKRGTPPDRLAAVSLIGGNVPSALQLIWIIDQFQAQAGGNAHG